VQEVLARSAFYLIEPCLRRRAGTRLRCLAGRRAFGVGVANGNARPGERRCEGAADGKYTDADQERGTPHVKPPPLSPPGRRGQKAYLNIAGQPGAKPESRITWGCFGAGRSCRHLHARVATLEDRLALLLGKALMPSLESSVANIGQPISSCFSIPSSSASTSYEVPEGTRYQP